MNSYQNKNEYEILNASPKYSNRSNRYPRYPLANNPQGSMKHTNYKDWLAMCENNQQYDVNPAEINSSSVSTALKILGTLVKLIEKIEGIGPVFTALSAILPVLWPPNTPTPERVWNDFMTNTGSLIDLTVTDLVRRDANAKMAVVKDNLNQYTIAFNNWNGNRNDPLYRTAVRDRFNSTNGVLRDTAVYFSNLQGYELLLLPIYTQVANFHLLLLRDGLINAQDWSLARDAGDQLYQDLVKYTNQYITHCITWYTTGLNTLKNRNVQWGAFNEYRREMTIQVLDIISLFSSYDPRKYPADIKDTTKLPKTELTREIYSALLDSPPNRPIAALEESLTRDVHLFTWPKRVDFWTFNYNMYPDVRFLSANRIGFSYTNSSVIQDSAIYGSTTFGTVLTRQIPLNSNVYRTSITNTTAVPDQVTKMDLYLTNGTSESYNSNITPVPNDLRTTLFGFSSNESRPNQPTVEDYTHNLSYIKTDIIGGHRSRVSFAWTHRTVDPNNQILTDNITQVPAVKSILLNAQAKVIKGPGHTGGDLVAITSNGTQSGRMEILCRASNFSDSERRYRLRIRFATNSNLYVYVTYTSNGIPRQTPFTTDLIPNNNERFFPGNTIPTDLRYEYFYYRESFNTILPMRVTPGELITIAIQPTNMLANQILIIDRIEFIPIPQSVLDYTEEQNLETAQESVNNLFIN